VSSLKSMSDSPLSRYVSWDSLFIKKEKYQNLKIKPIKKEKIDKEYFKSCFQLEISSPLLFYGV
jgi:hypothetical protein